MTIIGDNHLSVALQCTSNYDIVVWVVYNNWGNYFTTNINALSMGNNISNEIKN